MPAPSVVDSLPRTPLDGEEDVIAEAMRTIGLVRGLSLSIGIVSLLATTTEDPSTRDLHLGELADLHLQLRTHVDSVLGRGRTHLPPDSVPECQAMLRAYAERFSRTEVAVPSDRAVAAGLAMDARGKIVPAVYSVLAALDARREAAMAVRLARISEKAALVDSLLAEMARVGRMIGLISINASVEAARAGGDSGRAFQVIAEEVRTLSKQSATLLAKTKAGLIADRRVAPDPPRTAA